MFKILKYGLFFLVCLLVALVINLPLAQVLPWITLPSTIRLSGVDGTMIKGRAQQIVVNDFPVNGVEYRYLPTCVALLKVCYRITFDQGQLQVAYDLLNHDTEVTKTRIDYPVSELIAYGPNLLVKPVGNVELLVEDMTFEQGRPAVFKGKLVWRNLGIDDEGIKIDVGDYQLDISGENPKYTLKLYDLNASLDVNGDGEIGPGGVYNLDVRIESNSTIDPQVRYVLDIAAEKLSYNKYRIRHNGRLPPHIARQLF